MLETRKVVWKLCAATAACMVIALLCYFRTWTAGDTGYGYGGRFPLAAIIIAIGMVAAVPFRGRGRLQAVLSGAALLLGAVALFFAVVRTRTSDTFDREEIAAPGQLFPLVMIAACGFSLWLLVITLSTPARSGTGGSTEHPPASPAGATSTEGS